MKVILTIAVRNPEWYWTKEELDKTGDYRKEWEALNEDKVWKHVPSDSFEIPFEVKDIKENRKAEFEFKFTTENKAQSVSHIIKNLTIVQFMGNNENEKIETIISNSLIHQYIGARQKQYKYYVYFYLKENTNYEQLHQLIWLSEKDKLELEEKLGLQFNAS
jgi:hypothetical protein